MRSAFPLFLLAHTQGLFIHQKNHPMQQTITQTQDDRLRLRAWWRGEARYRAANLADPDDRVANPFVSVPCFSRDEFCNKLSLPGWQNGTALHYQDLCFTRDGNNDHWYVYRGRTFVAVLAIQPIAAAGNLCPLIDRLLTTPEEVLANQDLPLSQLDDR